MPESMRFSDYLIFAWWNTGLSPFRKASPEHHSAKSNAVQRILLQLITEGVDMIGLAEVNDGDIEEAQAFLKSSGYRYEAIKGTKKIGKTCFDLGVLYNPQKIWHQKSAFLTERWAGSNIVKIALNIEILPYLGNAPFHIFVSHWPSLLSNVSNREQYGFHLRRYIDQAFAASQRAHPYIVVMGDFNYEPFDKTLSEDIWATRDRIMASRKRNFLYNPFWRHLGEKSLFDQHSPVSDGLCGTYFYKQGAITRWKTVDQMMFSSSFINSGEWYLDEKFSLIWKNEDRDISSFHQYGFDHLPIISAVVFDQKMKE